MMRHIQQKGVGDCVIACVAMLSGDSYESVRSKHNTNIGARCNAPVFGVSIAEELQLLIQYGLHFNIAGLTSYLLVDNLYLVSVPSPGDPFYRSHRIILESKSDYLLIYDPLDTSEMKCTEPFNRVYFDVIQLVRMV